MNWPETENAAGHNTKPKSESRAEQGSSRKLYLSIGESTNRARITRQSRGTWPQIVRHLFGKLVESDTKDSGGWYCPARFRRRHRSLENFVSRSIVTLDFDHLAPDDIEPLIRCYSQSEFILHSTYSDGMDPTVRKMRLLLPLTREVDAQEYQALTRILIARFDPSMTKADVGASCNPVQFMWWPVKRPEMAWVFDGDGQPCKTVH